MPHSYHPNDTRRVIAATPSSRAECGLPEGSFVFCCFNAGQKITPTVFDAWGRLLKRVPGSVLWFSDLGPAATANLRREAATRDIAADRLIFAPRLPVAEHLARHRHADLFLDTHPFNAHSTMSDVLWSGLPAVTCAGDSFSGRVGASMLSNIGLGELVTTNLADYEALAFSLTQDRARLVRLRSHLAEHRRHAPLFDTLRFTRDLEEIYARMWTNFQSGKEPQRIELVEFSSSSDRRAASWKISSQG
jgi:predicted O-linked N-acetylglucosamine transferase (SPINDLY family)